MMLTENEFASGFGWDGGQFFQVLLVSNTEIEFNIWCEEQEKALLIDLSSRLYKAVRHWGSFRACALPVLNEFIAGLGLSGSLTESDLILVRLVAADYSGDTRIDSTNYQIDFLVDVMSDKKESFLDKEQLYKVSEDIETSPAPVHIESFS